MENRRGKDDEVFGGVWKTVETSTREVGMGETEGRRSKGGSRKKERGKREEKEEETKKGKTVEVRKVAEEWEIWDEEEEAAKSDAEAKKLVPEKFHK